MEHKGNFFTLKDSSIVAKFYIAKDEGGYFLVSPLWIPLDGRKFNTMGLLGLHYQGKLGTGITMRIAMFPKEVNNNA